MRYNLLGDIIDIKSALVYNRGYVDVAYGRNPVAQLNAVKTMSSDHTTFMEYSFKYKIDKGYYSDFNKLKMISKSTVDLMSDSKEINVPSDLLLYQLGEEAKYNYSLFEVFTSGELTNLLLDLDPKIQKIEFYEDFLDYPVDEDGYIHSVTEYSLTNPDPLVAKPIMIVEFGPEISYEAEDYYNTGEMDVKPSEWSDEDEHNYQLALDEYYNRKFLFITIAADSSTEINLSLHAHQSEDIQHRNQDKYVISNKDMRSIMNDHGTTITESNGLVLDNRSNTVLGTTSIDEKDLILLNSMKSVRSSDESYKPYVMYNYGDEVTYHGKKYRSGINGNIAENPSISPFWISEEDEYIPPEIEKVSHLVTVRVNDEKLGMTSPYGTQEVEYGHDLKIKLLPDTGEVKFIQLDGVNQMLPLKDTYTVMNVTEDHDVLVVYEPVYKHLRLSVNIFGKGVPYANSNAYGGDFIIKSEISIDLTIDDSHEFLRWEDKKGNIISTKSHFVYTDLIEDTELIAILRKKVFTITVSSNQGGVFEPYDGNPTVIESEYGTDVIIKLLPDVGFEVDRIEVDGKVTKRYKGSTYEIFYLMSDHEIIITYSRPKHVVTDPILGEIEFKIVGDQLWSTYDVHYRSIGMTYLNDMENELIGSYFNRNDLAILSGFLIDGGTGFRVPSVSDWRKLYDKFDEKLVGLKLKSDSIVRFDKYGWNSSIYRGHNEYGLGFMPYGSYTKPEASSGILFDGLNTESVHWSSDINEKDGSSYASVFYYDSPAGFLIENKLKERYIQVRLMSDTPKVHLIDKDYRYMTISVKITAKVYDGDTLTSNDLYEDYLVTQDWTLDNLDWTGLGVHYDNAKDSIYGSLYSLDDAKELNTACEGTGFRVPSDTDFSFLERYLGYGKDKYLRMEDGSIDLDREVYSTGYIGSTEGKRMKSGDFMYSDVRWNGYPTYSDENSMLEVLPGGYCEVTSDGLIFNDLGYSAKFWSLNNDSDDTSSALSIYSYSDKLSRSVEYGDRVKLSVRMVRTKIERV